MLNTYIVYIVLLDPSLARVLEQVFQISGHPDPTLDLDF